NLKTNRRTVATFSISNQIRKIERHEACRVPDSNLRPSLNVGTLDEIDPLFGVTALMVGKLRYADWMLISAEKQSIRNISGFNTRRHVDESPGTLTFHPSHRHVGESPGQYQIKIFHRPSIRHTDTSMSHREHW
ncbi:Hypothetical predicted protein, partial [Mytilus galloprovincialis]